jgi:hypothetical protein
MDNEPNGTQKQSDGQLGYDSNIQSPDTISTQQPVNTEQSHAAEAMQQLIGQQATDPNNGIVIKNNAWKNKKKLIIGACGIILALGIGVFTTFFVNAQKPENVLVAAVMGAIESNAVKLQGNVEYINKNIEDDEFGIKNMKIESDVESQLVPSKQGTNITITTTNDKEITLELENIILEDGALYLKIAGVKKSLEAFHKEIQEFELEEYLDQFNDIIEMMDGQWWKISLEDFESDHKYIDQYECTVKTLSEFGKNTSQRKEVANLYEKYPLLNVEKTDKKINNATGYDVSLNTENLANFLNNTSDLEIYKKMADCADIDLDGIDYEYDKEVFKYHESDEESPVITLYIGGLFNKELKEIASNYKNDDFEYNASIKLTFVDKINIVAPEDSKNIKELWDMIQERISSVIETIYGYEDEWDYDLEYGYEDEWDYDLEYEWDDEFDYLNYEW